MRKFFFVIVLLTTLLNSVTLSAQIITTIAGTGAVGYNGDSSFATSAQISYPIGVTIDRWGNIYFSDNGNNVVRKIDTSGVISTIAGNGIAGYSGDGGAAVQAKLNNPIGIAVDAYGNLYIADVNNYRVRKIDTSGVISTFAGDGQMRTPTLIKDSVLATNTQLNAPTSILVDKKNNIYIADYNGYRIRKVDTAHIITTVVGNGTMGDSGDGGDAKLAQIRSPYALAFDRWENLFVTDVYSSTVRRVDTSGVITTIAGIVGSKGYNGDSIVATSAKLYYPSGVVADDYGNIYIGDEMNNRIRKIDIAGMITTIVGTGVRGYNGDGIRADTARLYNPYTLALRQHDNGCADLYISDFLNSRIRKVSMAVANPELDITPTETIVCNGASVSFTTSVIRGGAAPSFQWRVNGQNVGADTSNYTYVPDSGDIVDCIVANNDCNLVTDTSNAVIISVVPIIIPSVSIIEQQNNVCEGTSVVFTAFATNAGTDPVYNWKVNNNEVGIDTALYEYIPVEGDIVTCIITNNNCSQVKDTSNPITMGVAAVLPPAIIIVESNNNICEGTEVVFTTDVTNEGRNPSYQWKVNGSNIGGDTSIFSYTPADNDTVVCIIINSDCAANVVTDTSNSIMIHIAVTTPIINISKSGDSLCAGTPVIYKAATLNGGHTPTYHWQVNGVNSGTDTTVFEYIPTDGDTITCIVTNNDCNPVSDTSNTIVMQVLPIVSPSITITESQNDICEGITVAYSSTIAHGGLSPLFQWQVNGSDIGTDTSYEYAPADGDMVSCIITSNAICRSIDTALSNTISMTVKSWVMPSVVISADPDVNVSNGQLVTFTAAPSNGGMIPQYQWRKNGTNILSANGDQYQAIAGTDLQDNDEISLWMASVAACADPDSANSNILTLDISSSTGISGVAGQLDMKLYPNPGNGDITLTGKWHTTTDKAVSVSVFNTVGQQVYTETVSVNSSMQTYSLKLAGQLQPGTYMLKVSGEQSATIKFVVLEK